ncbi:unnamed protein product [Rotaria magnacalcarata]|uniref:THAP9-like helix-turn-helix domain-containing protein n=1 Tax=Rotaria magnacalcarata TaxID=392030 RepID=A0A816CFX4_9BILA|nr:unnamed protein product [Rotaria magnacalcarata]CAF3828970.1 unnamed protein product [Rotaria magnacalcarata]
MLKQLPSNFLNYSHDNFYQLVKQRCGDDVVEFMKLLDISSIQSLLGIENLLGYLEIHSEKLNNIKKKLTFQHENGLVEVKWGVQHSLEYFIQDLRMASDNSQYSMGSIVSNEDMFLSSSFLQKHPKIKCLIDLFQVIDEQNHEDNSEQSSFLNYFLDNISSNLCRSKNAYRYTEPVLQFATSLHILGGKVAYEFMRLNLPGALPALSTLQTLALNRDYRIKEGEFRFDSLATHMQSLETNIAFASEDSTVVIKKVSYDSHTNSFVGFELPLNDGIPTILYYQTDSFQKLREWFSSKDRSNLINIHMVQPISNIQLGSNPFLLFAFGTKNIYETIDIIRRWIWIFEQSLLKNVRIVGFSTDGDPKYMRAMRLSIGFFATLPNVKLDAYKDSFHVNIPEAWNWYFLGDSHLFLCFQDATHLCTKLRNRLLSRTAHMLIGKRCISIDYLSVLIRSNPKLRHGLVKSDIFPQDRQNFSSCVKICSDDVISCLNKIKDSEGVIMYLRLLRSIMIAYVDKLTTPIDRLYHAWFSVFINRLWYIWIDSMKKIDLDTSLYELTGIKSNQKYTKKKEFFITNNAYYCIEINAHQLTYLALLVIEKKLPLEALNIYLFSSQTCEGMFRSARSMSGTFSSIVNFSVQEFLNRTQKLSLLNKIKTESEFGSNNNTIVFPKHHKQSKQWKQPTRVTEGNNELNLETMTQIIKQAYNDATELLYSFDTEKLFCEKKLTTIKQVNNCMQDMLRKRINIQDYSELNEQYETSSSDDGSDISLSSESHTDSEDQVYNEHPYETSTVSSDQVFDDLNESQFTGMRLFDTVRPELAKSYFEVEINQKRKYLHKQTACWILTENKPISSNDRLARVRQR